MEAERRREFNRTVSSVVPEYAEIEFRHGAWGDFARVTNINGEGATTIEHRLENNEELGTERIESGGGLGVEIFSTEE